ncbi:MAG: flavodoxin family protein [Oscillospiraceae bacterium]|nr:flavodoxin family protein [Oscillospiraceae bacterium]
MSKKILVLTGSARKDGNSNRMAQAFADAAAAKGHDIKVIDTAKLKLNFCHACQTCYKTGKPCSFDDDFNVIAPDILAADALVFSCPVYWYSVPSQIKAVIDKMFSFVIGEKEGFFGKECALITCCEEEDPAILDGVKIPFERTAALNKWTVVDEVLVPGVFSVGDIDKTDGIAQAAALADKF